MIGKLKGILQEVENTTGLIETSGGVSYLVFLTPSFLKKNRVGGKVEIYTFFHVREDAQVLFGFEAKEENDFFKMLLTVPGVGPKTAYSIISFQTIALTLKAVKENDSDLLTSVPGLGKKTALKIILELSQKLNQEFSFEKMYLSDEDKTVVEALMSLGYRSGEAKKLLPKIPKKLTVEEKVQAALKLIK